MMTLNRSDELIGAFLAIDDIRDAKGQPDFGVPLLQKNAVIGDQNDVPKTAKIGGQRRGRKIRV